jgi:hypothetical protein
MDLFGKTPQEQAMQKLIHDTRNSSQDLRLRVSELGKFLGVLHRDLISKGLENPISSVPYIHIEYMKTRIKEFDTAIDAYYLKFKNDFKENDKEKKDD